MDKEKMLGDMRAMVIKAMWEGKIIAFNMCRSATNFHGQFKSDIFPAEIIFDFDKCRRIATWLTPEEMKTGEEDNKVHPNFMVVVVFKSASEEDLITGLQGIPGAEFMKTCCIKKPLL